MRHYQFKMNDGRTLNAVALTVTAAARDLNIKISDVAYILMSKDELS